MSSVIKNLKGKKFGKLSVLSYSHMSNKKAHWLCKCSCGKEKIIRGTRLTSGDTRSCGCFRGAPGVLRNWLARDLFGLKIRTLKITRLLKIKKRKNGRSERLWLCVCDCKREFSATTRELTRSTYPKSCVCVRKNK
jgi:hypothetical protein